MNKPDDSSTVLTLIDVKRMVNVVERNILQVFCPVKTTKRMVHLIH
jgi:hypothetical protein